MEEREKLVRRGRGKKMLDMEKVYRQLDNGRTVKDVAAEWGVSESTLYRRHREYQREVKAILKDLSVLEEENKRAR